MTITLSRLATDASSVPSFKFILHVNSYKPTVVLKRSFWKFFERILLTLRHLQSFVVPFIEQVQNIEKSKASVVEVVSCFATVKAMIHERKSDVHIKSS